MPIVESHSIINKTNFDSRREVDLGDRLTGDMPRVSKSSFHVLLGDCSLVPSYAQQTLHLSFVPFQNKPQIQRFQESYITEQEFWNEYERVRMSAPIGERG